MYQTVAERCPRCQQEVAGTALFQCRGCKNYCCEKCVGGPPHYGGWGVAYSCPACQEGMTNESIVGVVRKLTPQEVHERWLASLPRAEREAHDLLSVRKPSCTLPPAHLGLLPRLAAERGPTLEVLCLQGATDADLGTLVGLVGQFLSLRRVELVNCPALTDAGLRLLVGLPNLTYLHLASLVSQGQPLPISLEAVNVVRQALPKCEIHGGPKKPWWKFW